MLNQYLDILAGILVAFGFVIAVAGKFYNCNVTPLMATIGLFLVLYILNRLLSVAPKKR